MGYLLIIPAWILWISVGFYVVDKIDKTGDFTNWLMSDDAGFLSHIIMTAWPLIACLAHKRNKIFEEH